MKVLIVGSGGREHALAWQMAKSELVEEIYVAPGNAGTELTLKVANVAILASDISGLKSFALKQQIDLTVVGPEGPLIAGIVDAFKAGDLVCFGPTKAAAILEGSKSFAKGFLRRHNIPTAPYAVFEKPTAAIQYVASHEFPVVIKADGLAAGKGVIIANNLAEAKIAINELLVAKRFGAAGNRIVIEEHLNGEEATELCPL